MDPVSHCPLCGAFIHVPDNRVAKCKSCGHWVSISKDDDTVTIRVWKEGRKPLRSALNREDLTRTDLAQNNRDFAKDRLVSAPERKRHTRDIAVTAREIRRRSLIDIPASPSLSQFWRIDRRDWPSSRVMLNRQNTPQEIGIGVGLTSMIFIGAVLLTITSIASFQWTAEAMAAAVLLTVIFSTFFGLGSFFSTKPVDSNKPED